MKSIHINRNNIHSFCRTCLTEIGKLSYSRGQKFNIHKTPHLLRSIKICTPLIMAKNDEYPEFVCAKCYESLRNLFEFREMSIKSRRILDTILREVDSTKVIQLPTTNTNPSDNESESEEQELIIGNQNVTKWLDFKIDNELIVPVAYNNSIIKEMEENTTGTVKKHLEIINSFEHKKCSENSIDENVKNDQLTKDTLDNESSLNVTDKCEISLNSNAINLAKDSSDVTIICDEAENCIKTTKGSFQCTLCPRYFYKQKNLDRHLRVHQGLKAYQCNQCDRGYSNKQCLKIHISRDHENTLNKEIICTIEGCGFKCRNSVSYKFHFRRNHTDYQRKTTMAICEDCGLSFKTNSSLKKHRFKHGPPEAYPFNCKQCGKCFPTEYKYKQHMDRHAGIKNFECPICGLKKTTNDELRSHLKYHTNIKQSHCMYCASTFNNSGNLSRHIRLVHEGIRQYKCKYCTESFGNAESLKHHEMRHTGEKPHECQTCGKCFIQKTALRTHMKIHEKIQIL